MVRRGEPVVILSIASYSYTVPEHNTRLASSERPAILETGLPLNAEYWW